MSADDLLNALREFEGLVGERRARGLVHPGELHFTATNFTFSARRNDWGRSGKSEGVQAAFNARPRFPRRRAPGGLGSASMRCVTKPRKSPRKSAAISKRFVKPS